MRYKPAIHTCCNDDIIEVPELCVSLLPTPLSLSLGNDCNGGSCTNEVLVGEGAAGWYPVNDVATIAVVVATVGATLPVTDDVAIAGDNSELVAVLLGERAELG